MRGASIADVHLGFRAGNRTQDGRNLRELDVEKAWQAAVEGICESEVELVTIAGDLVHHPRVSVHALKAMIDGLARMVQKGMRVLLVQGNHDMGKTLDSLTPLHLVHRIHYEPHRLTGWHGGVEVFDEPRSTSVPESTDPSEQPTGRINLGRPEWSIFCLPCTSGMAKEIKLPLANMLVVHAPLAGGGLPAFYAGDQHLSIKNLRGRYQVVAAGDYHVFTDLAPEEPSLLAFYSGSLERTSSNFWAETEPKGWVLWDTQDSSMELVEVPTRPMVSMEVHPTPERVNAAMRRILAMPKGTLVRLKADHFPRGRRDEIDAGLLRKCKLRHAMLRLDVRYEGRESAAIDRREGGRTILEEADSFFAYNPADQLCRAQLGLLPF